MDARTVKTTDEVIGTERRIFVTGDIKLAQLVAAIRTAHGLAAEAPCSLSYLDQDYDRIQITTDDYLAAAFTSVEISVLKDTKLQRKLAQKVEKAGRKFENNLEKFQKKLEKEQKKEYSRFLGTERRKLLRKCQEDTSTLIQEPTMHFSFSVDD
ncbi:MAG: hypothetical protein EZS28_042855 [Streblomastix strix]|uniref:PB1 domain-containing protein n=1 Tax=Streblomastix strix TaxID=222440 RepID=A0A5J4TUT3_9EUKA|nr:MAG: hypothetical protein EZS28_042855 [Streblomastix strix]